VVAALLGPTAAGKTAVAMILARRYGAHVVSVDSAQVYRGMDIGTAKPSPAYRAEVPHHLIDLVDPEVSFSVAEFQAAGCRVVDELRHGGVPVLIVGGSGLHFRSLVDPLEFPPTEPSLRAELEALSTDEARRALLEADPGAGGLVDLDNPRRVVRALEVHRLTGRTPTDRAASPAAAEVRRYRARLPLVALGIDPAVRLRDRVVERFDGMLAGGFAAEVAELAPRLGPTARAAVGYRQWLRVIEGAWSEPTGRRRAIEATTALARRQRTFFRPDPRIRWLEWDDDPARPADEASSALEEAGWTS
jgi:tRNA dimethylallyltransferase